ncbi:flagellar biosynthesis protein FlgA [Photobacterium jeanii]|uniref:Flagella basal body P-ring formation protein FlgA n=1 Tax=Photobacterium jeanii TaxID=858640 RepID=A0A178KMM6_9GAMM|nr:flagellar basal body P-ring formation chaperone FlgA [Photobacterium jeanii]OAN18638.1 flagellar biosynthesis protein FlgA [Photobacterium jeanii]PST91682.1 flagella basal body P-ring formation protein FlgA [Photobacterium jeanii]
MTNRAPFSPLVLIVGLFSIIFSAIVHGTSTNYLHTVQQTAKEFVLDNVEPPQNGELQVTPAQLDSRLRLTECSMPLNTSIPGKQSMTGNVTVLINCPTENWQVYVPVRVKLLLPRVVATKPLPRGTVIAAADLTIKLVENRFQRSISFEEPSQVIGSKVKRGINMGDTIEGNDICLVCRNESVLIRAGNSGLNIVTNGTALSDGSLGDQIRIQNNKSKRVVDGIITGVGEVTVNF